MTTWDAHGVTAADWNRLAQGVPFRTWEWNQSWWRHYGPSVPGSEPLELFVLYVFDDSGCLIGVAPWYLTRSFTARGIRFLGSGEVCSDYQTILCTPGSEDEVAGAIAAWLSGDSTSADEQAVDHWDFLELSGVVATDASIPRLSAHLAERNNRVHQRLAANCWRLRMPPTWDEYVACLSKSHRKQVRRVERRMFETGRAVHREVCRPDELSRGLDILIDLHQKRRRSLGEPGCFASERFTAFHRDVAARMLEQASLRLSWVEFDGRPVAAEYHLAGAGIIYAYQSGLDPEALEVEPGRLAAVATLKRAVECGTTAFDFLRGDEPYKAHWRAEPVPTVDLRIANAGISSRLSHQMWLAGDNVKNWIKAGLDLTGDLTGFAKPG